VLRNCAVDFFLYLQRLRQKAAKRIFNSDKICRSYSDLNFGVTFWNTVYIHTGNDIPCSKSKMIFAVFIRVI